LTCLLSRILEENLDSTIRAPLQHRDELASFVHRPVFKHVLYEYLDRADQILPDSLRSLQRVVQTLDIEQDPYVCYLRRQLGDARIKGTPQYSHVDKKLSKTLLKKDTYTYKGLNDFCRAAEAICNDVGPWAADWFIQTVLANANAAARPYHNPLSTSPDSEKSYLLRLLSQVNTSPISYEPHDICSGTTNKVQVLVECLQVEKATCESYNQAYSGLIFVDRRDTVLALTEVLSHHPGTTDYFKVGCLLGASDNPRRQSFLDITRQLLRQSQSDTLMKFRIGEKSLLVATAVAEEGLDVSVCGNVIRWDPPANMVSWAQSRGRARRQRSTFVVLFDDQSAHQKSVADWERLENEMIRQYNDMRRVQRRVVEEMEISDNEDDYREFLVAETGYVSLFSCLFWINRRFTETAILGHF
jgi:endoribonuclease Dicer